MTIKVSKPSINLREKLNELDQKQGLKGTELMRADTVAEARSLIGAGRKNLVINGAMQVAQRETSSTTQGFATVDRFSSTSYGTMVAAVVTQSQDSTGPQGFSNSYKVSVGTSESVAAVDYYSVQHGIEAQNLQHLGFGTSDANKLTLSFWVKSSVTGTYTVSIFRHDAQRIFPKTYTVDAASTWEYKTITIDADTTGTIANDNGRGIDIYWILSAGSNYTGGGTDNTWQAYTSDIFANDHTADIIGVTNATWQISGVQLEVGDTATDFEHRSYGEELALCQRYFTQWTGDQNLTIATGVVISGTSSFVNLQLPTAMRSAPTLTQSNTYIYEPQSATVSSLGTIYATEQAIGVNTIHANGLSSGAAAVWLLNADSGYVRADAEL